MKLVSETPILKIAVNVPLSRVFDYLPLASEPQPVAGQRVLVPFGKRQKVGLVIGYSNGSDVPLNKLKRCVEVLDDAPLFSKENLWLIQFTSDYYHHPIGEVVAATLPSLLRQGRPLHSVVEKYVANELSSSFNFAGLAKRAPKQAKLLQTLLDAGNDGLNANQLNEMLPKWRNAKQGLMDKGLMSSFECHANTFNEQLVSAKSPDLNLNEHQQDALTSLRCSNQFGVYLLDGVTGSGKTEVYLQRVQDVLKRDKQVLILVPEIGLTPQLVKRLSERLGLCPALLHSGLSDNARLTAWQAAQSGAAHLVVGTRSAIFTPMSKLGLIIVDEEHDQSFKQQEGLRYSARDLAIARAKHQDIPVILGSATPTLEMLQHCRNGAYKHIILPARAGGANPPTMHLIDTVRTPVIDGVSEPLAEAIRQTLDNDSQVLIFLNRRGFAPTLVCSACGHIAGCNRCDSRLTVHSRSRQLQCHHCGACRALNEHCEKCGETVKPLGEGTERLEDTLRHRFPTATINRIDSDSTQHKGAMDAALQSATSGEADILIGTQMLSKGHHFPALTLVGVVNADQGLFGTDFRSGERMAQSIIQVAGRAGRTGRPGKVLIQTAFPENKFWRTLMAGGYRQLSDNALAERKITGWPPFTYLALIRSAAHKLSDTHHLLNIAKRYLDNNNDDALQVLGPVDAPMARKAGRYRAQLLLQSSDRSTLHRVLSEVRHMMESEPAARKVRWSIDVDPIELF